jgi:2'-5' RNA ligase
MAVALLVPPPAAIEIDGLRRALGDRQLGRIEPHITLVPPINVREDDLAAAMAVVQAAASGREPIELEIGPVETFARESPVRFLAVDPWEPVTDLRRDCVTGVLERADKRPFHPHVTVDIDGSPTDGDDPAVAVLAGYRTEVTIDRVTLLEHTDSRRWEPYMSYRLA